MSSDEHEKQVELTKSVYELLVQEKRRRIALEEELEIVRGASWGGRDGGL